MSKILFDHFYIVVSPKTYQALAINPIWTGLFAEHYEQNVKTGEGEEWTGYYLTTLNHRYVELLAEGARVNEGYVDGAAGIGLCSNKAQNDAEVIQYYETHLPDSKPNVATRILKSKKSGRDVSWFTYVMPHDYPQTPFLKPWVMIYQNEYLEGRGQALSENREFDRDQFIVTGLKTDASIAQIKAIEEITVNCTTAEYSKLSDQLVALGFAKTSNLLFELPEFKLHLSIELAVKHRITKVLFRLSRDANISHQVNEIKLISSGSVLSLTIEA